MLNTIDTDPPSSSVTALPATSQATFTVSWTGSDRGAGVDSYDVYVSEDGGPFQIFLQGTTGTSATFEGEGDHRYKFASVARDRVGHTEDLPATGDAETMVILAPTPKSAVTLTPAPESTPSSAASIPTDPREAALETAQPDEGSPLGIILGFTFGVLAVAGAGGALVVRRRKASKAAI